MKKGDKVKMSKELKDILNINGCSEHAEEFGDCIGIIDGLCYPDIEGDEWDVRWLPSMLRYAYSSEHLVLVEES